MDQFTTNERVKTYLTTDEAANVIGVTARTMRSWKLRGVGPAHIRVGGVVRYLRDDLDSWMCAGRCER